MRNAENENLAITDSLVIQLERQRDDEEKSRYDYFLDNLIDNPIARSFSTFGKVLFANKKLFIKAFINYGTFRTMLSYGGCLPNSPFETEPQKCIFTNHQDPLINDDALFYMALANLGASIFLTSFLAHTRKFYLENEGSDIVDNIPRFSSGNLGSGLSLVDDNIINIMPPAFGSSINFFFMLNKDTNKIVPIANLLFNMTTLCFFNDNFLGSPKEEFLRIIQSKKPSEQEISNQSDDLVELNQAIQNILHRSSPQSRDRQTSGPSAELVMASYPRSQLP